MLYFAFHIEKKWKKIINNLITDFSNPIYTYFNNLQNCLSLQFLTDTNIDELLVNNEELTLKNDKLDYLLQNNLISQYVYDKNKDITTITRVVKCYALSILNKDDPITTHINDIVKEVSFNDTIASRALALWVQEPHNTDLIESNQDFLNDTLNNTTFFRQLFRGAGNENIYIKDSESWNLIKPKINKLVGTEYSNSVGSLCEQYIENLKLHITTHITTGLPNYVIRYALENLEDAKLITYNK